MEKKRIKKIKFNYITMLKALSLIAVSLYHLFSHRLSGGFLGVIIFMIISGFFLAKSSKKSSEISDINFFIGKIKRRIFKIVSPMWVIVSISLLVSLIFARDIFDDSIRSSIPTILGFENIRAIIKGISYFDRSGNFNIFTHLWYISVYLQFIIIYYTIDYLINRYQLNSKRIEIFAILTVISTAISYYLSFTKASIVRIYYGTDVRLAAFFVGVIGFLIYDKRKDKLDKLELKKIIYVLLALVIVPFFFINGKNLWVYRAFFLVYQLIVVALIIVIYRFEETNPKKYKDYNPFFKFLICLGDRSYYYYLWQYIVQVFMTYLLINKIDNRLLFYLVGLVVLVVLAEISYYFRRVKKSSKIKSLIGALFLVGILNIVSLAIGNKKEAQMNEFKKEFSKNEEEIDKRNELAKKNNKNKPKKNISKKDDKKSNDNFKEKPYDDFNFTENELNYLKNISITAIGDSVLVNIDSYLREFVPNLYLDGEVGRSMSDGPNTLLNIESQVGLNDLILVVLGSNGLESTDDMQKIVDEAGGRDVYFVNTSHLQSYMDQVNKEIKTFADNNPKAHLVDWRSFVKDRDDLLAVDRVHPNVDGSYGFAKLILRKILNTNKVNP